jgi:hypothetical protein
MCEKREAKWRGEEKREDRANVGSWYSDTPIWYRDIEQHHLLHCTQLIHTEINSKQDI